MMTSRLEEVMYVCRIIGDIYRKNHHNEKKRKRKKDQCRVSSTALCNVTQQENAAQPLKEEQPLDESIEAVTSP